MVGTRTLYNYIRDGLFYGLGEEALPRGKRRKGHAVRRRRVALNNPTGTGIRERTAVINEWLEDGHWEMDTVAVLSRPSDPMPASFQLAIFTAIQELNAVVHLENLLLPIGRSRS